LSERASQDVFASVEDLRATIAILPLLNNRLVIEEVSLGGLKAQVQRAQLGHFLLDDLLGWGQAQSSSSQASDVGLLMDDITVDIAEILIKKSEFTVLDASKKATWKLQDASLEFGRITKGQPFKAELNARIQHADSSAQAKLSAQATLNIDLASRELSARNLNASFKGDLPDSIWFEEVFKKVDLTLSAVSMQIEPATGRLRLDRFSMRTKGLRDGAAFEYTLDAPLLDISNASAHAEGLTSRLRMDGSPAIDARLVLDGLRGNRNKLLFERSNLDLAIKRDARVLKLVLSSPIEIEPFTPAMNMKAMQGEVQSIQAPVAKTLLSMPVNGRLSVSFDHRKDIAQPLQVVGQMDNFPFVTLMEGLGIDSFLDGHAAVDLSIRLAPSEIRQFKQSLTGTVQLRLSNVRLAGIDLGTGLDALRAIALTDKSSANFVLDRSKHTAFDTAEFDVRIDRNVAYLSRLKMLAPGWAIHQAASGKINLQNDTIDLALSLQLLGLQSLTTKRVTIQVRSLTVPLRVVGPIAQPEVLIQWATLDRDPIGRALKDKLIHPSVESRSPSSLPNHGTQKNDSCSGLSGCKLCAINT